MNIKKLVYFSMMALSSALFLFMLFTIYSFVIIMQYIYDVGGLSPFNYSDVVGHILILFFSLGCLYFSLKTTLKLKKN